MERVNTEATQEAPREILLIHLNDMQMSTYSVAIGNTNAMALFNSGTMLRCISKQFYEKIQCL